MRVLLDTNSFLWFIGGNDRLSPNAKNIIADLDNKLFLSTASLWEIAIKVSIGKLNLLQPFGQLIPQQLVENDINVMPIALNHLTRLMDIPFHHRDPFDRLIIAQAVTENLPLISSDTVFSKYPVKLVW